MAWSYRFRADDQLYADNELGPTVFDPSASLSGSGTGNVSTAGTPTINQVAIWQDGLHIAGFTLLPAMCMPALTGDITVAAGTTVTVYGNPVPVAKGGVPAGGTTGQILTKGSNADYAVGWVAPVGGGVTLIASGVATLGTAAIASGGLASVVTVSAPGVLTTDVIQFTPNADISAVTGYAPVTAGGLMIYPYPTAGAVNFKVGNPTAASVTPGAVTLNWRVVR